jgi:hypothetical protein
MMKVSKERIKLCSDVTNSAEIKLKKDLERRREMVIERNMDRTIGYVLLFACSVVLLGEIIMFVRDLL